MGLKQGGSSSLALNELHCPSYVFMTMNDGTENTLMPGENHE